MPESLANDPVIRQLMDTIRGLEDRVARAEARVADLGTPFGRLVLVQRGIDAGGDPNDNGKLWKEWTVVNGDFVEFEDGRGCDDPESDAKLWSHALLEFAVEFQDAESTRYVPIQKWNKVTLEEDGTGADGTTSSPATWKYTAKLNLGSGDVTIGTGLTPQFPGRPNGKTAKATNGYCSITENLVQLILCDEHPVTGAC